MSYNIQQNGNRVIVAGKSGGNYDAQITDLSNKISQLNNSSANKDMVLTANGNNTTSWKVAKGGHDMANSVSAVLSSVAADNKVVNAFTISEFSNVYTEMIGAILTEGNNTIGTWFEEGETWDTTQMLQDDRLIEQDGEQLNIQFDFWVGEAQGSTLKANTTPLHITGYQWDSVAGALTIRCAETAPNDITVVIKITHIRERSE